MANVEKTKGFISKLNTVIKSISDLKSDFSLEILDSPEKGGESMTEAELKLKTEAEKAEAEKKAAEDKAKAEAEEVKKKINEARAMAMAAAQQKPA